MNYPKVFIIILNWNGLQDTLECLESVFNLDYPNFEVIVVDNGSIDDSVEIISKRYTQVILIANEENLGYTGGNNIGMRYAMEHTADYMWLLNNDTVVEPDTLSKLVDAAEKFPDIGLVSPVIYYYDEPDKVQFCGSYVDWGNSTILYAAIKDAQVSDEFQCGENVCLWGTALLINKHVVEKVGYLMEKYFAYWEDTEYSIRAIKGGCRNLICPSARIYHKTAPPLPGVVQQSSHYFYYMIRNQYLLGAHYFKEFGRLYFLRKYLSDVLVTTMYCSRCNNSEAAEACLDGAWAGIRGIGGPWDKSVKMPAWLKKVFYCLSSWHPYFWASLLKGEFLNISSEALKRIRLSVINLYH